MIIERKHDTLEISLDQQERAALLLVFEKILSSYHMPPEELDPRVESEWYQTGINRKAGFSASEYEEWRDALHFSRIEHNPFLEKWISLLNNEQNPLIWSLPLDEIDALLMVTNDYRLQRAAESDLTEEDMSRPFNEVEDPNKRMAILEIESLATLGGALIQSVTHIPDEPFTESEQEDT